MPTLVCPRRLRLVGQQAAGDLTAADGAARRPGALSGLGVLAHVPCSGLFADGPGVGDQVRLGVHSRGLDLTVDGFRVLWGWPEIDSFEVAEGPDPLVRSPLTRSTPLGAAPLRPDAAAVAFSVPLAFGTRVLWRVGASAVVVRLPLVGAGQVQVARRS